MVERIANCHFNWGSFKNIENNIPVLAKAGFTAVQTPPIQPYKIGGPEWYWMYQIIGFSIGNTFGTKEDLISLANVCHKYGMKLIIDFILDHLAGSSNNPLYPDCDLCDKDLISKGEYWLDPIQNSSCERWQMTHRCYGLPRLNYLHQHVMSRYARLIDELMEFADGLRIDMAGHFELPWEYGENCQFWKMIKEHTKGKEVYGEFINQPRWLLDRYTEYTDCLIMDQIGEKPSNINDAIVSIETHDSYWSNDLGKFTSRYSNEEILRMYSELCGKYDRTMFFCRPWIDLKSEELKIANCKRRSA